MVQYIIGYYQQVALLYTNIHYHHIYWDVWNVSKHDNFFDMWIFELFLIFFSMDNITGYFSGFILIFFHSFDRSHSGAQARRFLSMKLTSVIIFDVYPSYSAKILRYINKTNTTSHPVGQGKHKYNHIYAYTQRYFLLHAQKQGLSTEIVFSCKA